MLAFPGGAGYGKASDRDAKLVQRDLARGYISAQTAKQEYGMSQAEITAVLEATHNGEIL